eukprot:TRINITY_DN25476_c0_g1_i1.p1 TRINITY_DN25476_c0_g1~~TRINITY_DN25476_c0_g1_i1.p1  ORF type:complete len:1401 (-),score=153.16 TRINITY_DN25476_c0_g1_i1:142-4344(-)
MASCASSHFVRFLALSFCITICFSDVKLFVLSPATSDREVAEAPGKIVQDIVSHSNDASDVSFKYFREDDLSTRASSAAIWLCDTGLPASNDSNSTIQDGAVWQCQHQWYNACPCIDEHANESFVCSSSGMDTCVQSGPVLMRLTKMQSIWLQFGWIAILLVLAFFYGALKVLGNQSKSDVESFDYESPFLQDVYKLLWHQTLLGKLLELLIFTISVVFFCGSQLDVKAWYGGWIEIEILLLFLLISTYIGRLYACPSLPYLKNSRCPGLKYAITSVEMWCDVITVFSLILNLAGNNRFYSLIWLRFPRLFSCLSRSKFGTRGMDVWGTVVGRNRDILVVPALISLMTWVVAATFKYLVEQGNTALYWGVEPGFNRYASIPSSLSYTLIDFVGEFPQADEVSNPLGRIIAMGVCAFGSIWTQVPAGIISYSFTTFCRERSAREGAREVYSTVPSPGELDRWHWLSDCPAGIGLFVCTTLSILVFALSTHLCQTVKVEAGSAIRLVPEPGSAAFVGLAICRLFEAVVMMPLFMLDWVVRLRGAPSRCSFLFSFRGCMDIMSFLPSVGLLVLLFAFDSCVEDGQATNVARAQLCLHASVAIRLVKLDRFMGSISSVMIDIFKENYRVFTMHFALLVSLWGMGSMLMHLSERSNPDPDIRVNYETFSASIWLTLVNLAGESPLNDYTHAGKAVHFCIVVVGIVMFTVPMGIFGAALRSKFDEACMRKDHLGTNLLAYKRKSLRQARIREASMSGGMTRMELLRDLQRDPHDSCFPSLMALEPGTRRYIIHKIMFGTSHPNNATNRYAKRVETVVKAVTLFGCAVSILETLPYFKDNCTSAESQLTVPAATWCPPARLLVTVAVDVCVILWFVEFLVRFACHPWPLKFLVTGPAIIDILAIVPSLWLMFLQSLGVELDPFYVRLTTCSRIWRIFALDNYTQGLHVIGDVFRSRWPQVLQLLYVMFMCWMILTHINWFFLHSSTEMEQGRTYMEWYGDYFRAMQFSLLHMSGDYFMFGYPRSICIVHAISLLFSWTFVAMPASLVTSAFSDALEARRIIAYERRMKASARITRLFRRALRLRRLHAIIKLVCEQHAQRRRALLSRRYSNVHVLTSARILEGRKYRRMLIVCTTVYLTIVALRSIPELGDQEHGPLWDIAMTPFVIFFGFHFITRLRTAPLRCTSRWPRLRFLMKGRELCLVVAFVCWVVHLFTLWLKFASEPVLLASQMIFVLQVEDVFHTQRLTSLLWTEMRSNIGSIFFVYFLFWILTSTLWYLAEVNSDIGFNCIPSTLYYTFIFLFGEWCKFDFTPMGRVLSIVYAILGLAIASMPTGAIADALTVLIESKGSGFVLARKRLDDVNGSRFDRRGTEPMDDEEAPNEVDVERTIELTPGLNTRLPPIWSRKN